MAKLKQVFRSLRSRVKSACALEPSKARPMFALIRTRAFSIGFFALISLLILFTVFLQTKIVRVIDGDGVRYVRTFRTSPESILSQCGLSLSTGDEYRFDGFKNNYGTINLFEAFPVQVTADNRTRQVLIARGTVKDALQKARISLGPEDLTSSPLSSQVSSGMNIVVRRVSYRMIQQTQVLGYKIQQIPSVMLKKGTTTVQTPGKNGELSRTVRQKYIDGQLSEQTVIGETVKVQPVDSKVLVGNAASTPVSTIVPPSSFSLTDSGIPSRYSRVIDAVATAYTAKPGSGTASGRRAGVGMVAVDPRVIPYGTRLYIMSGDGSFVYGYSIAADTGEFVSNGSGIDTDLYFASLSDCKRFGKRHVKIYVLQ